MTWLGYSRVSRVGDRAERLISPDQQAERIRSYATARGLEVEMLEAELDVSGGKVERPIFSEAISRIEAGDAEGIIVSQLDRLSRAGIIDTLKVIERIEAAGGQAIAVAENVDASTPEGRMQREIMLSLGNMQLARYSDQFKSAKRQAVERGIWPTNTAPRGYKLKYRRDEGDGRLHVDRSQAAKVVRAFDARAAGRAWSAITEILGCGYSGARKTIQNRAYLGEINLRVDGETVRNTDAHEAIIPRDLWEAAQISHPRPARGVHGPALLSGLVRCASCQHTMTVDVTHGSGSYRCRGRFAGGRCAAPAVISQRKIEPYIEQIVLAELRSHVKPKPRTDELEEARRALEGAEAELDDFQIATKASGVGAEHFASGLRDRVADVEAARETLGRTRAGEAPDHADALDAWPELSVEERRHVLAGALGVIWVRRGRLPVEDRVRLVPRGQEPADLSRPGRRAGRPSPLVWDDLPIEVRAATP